MVKKKPQLYIGKAIHRFLLDERETGYAGGIEPDCVKPKVGLPDDTILEELEEHHPRDISVFPVDAIITKSLQIVPAKSRKLNVLM